jgi:hypothetical protein
LDYRLAIRLTRRRLLGALNGNGAVFIPHPRAMIYQLSERGRLRLE